LTLPKLLQTNEAGHSRNLPSMLCFHNSARTLTAPIYIQVLQYRKDKTAVFYISPVSFCLQLQD